MCVAAFLPQDDRASLVKQHRQKELELRRKTFRQVVETLTLVHSCHGSNDDLPLRWKEWQPGFPMSIDADRHKDLPRDIQFDSEKGVDFVLNYTKAYVLDFGGESTPPRCHHNAHQVSLLGITWRDEVTHTSHLKRTHSH